MLGNEVDNQTASQPMYGQLDLMSTITLQFSLLSEL